MAEQHLAQILNFGIDRCANCFVFDCWLDPADATKLKKCSRCKSVQYCGKLCQAEHWKRVHKSHCGFLDTPAKAKESVHKMDCGICKEITSEVTLPNNPTYPCILFSPLPFPLAQLPEDRREHTIVLLMKILFKIVFTNHPIYVAQPNKIMELVALVQNALGSIWWRRKVFPEGHGRRWAIDECPEIVALAMNIERVEDNTTFQLWDLFNVILGGLQSQQSYQHNFKDFHASILELQTEVSNHFLKQLEDHLIILDQVMNAISSHLIPYKEVVRIVCGGQLQQSCNTCHTTVTVKNVDVDNGDPVVHILNAFERDINCGRAACLGAHLRKKSLAGMMSNVICTNRAGSLQCDNCFKLSPPKKTHRVTCCLKRQYCSHPCMEESKATHSEFCRKDGEEWKVKRDKKSRVDKAKEKADPRNGTVLGGGKTFFFSP